MRNVLVTGGTGFIGSNLGLALFREGCDVRILRRPDSDLRAIGNAPVQHCVGDVRDPESLTRAMKGCDTVFHTAAIVSYWRKERSTMYDVNIGGTRNVVNACLALGVENLVHTSSVAAVGFSENDGVVDESNVFNWDRYDVGYRISKFEAEKEIARGVRLGLRAVIANPSVVIGPRDIHFHGGQIIRDVYKKRIFYYTDGGMNIVYVDDVVRGHMCAARYGRAGERYILSGENLSHRDVFRITARVVGGIDPFFKIPLSVVPRVASAAEALGNFLNVRPWVARELVAGIKHRSWFTSEKARRELGYTHIPFDKAVEKTFQWYKENNLL